MITKLTATRLSTLRRCQRQEFLRYILGLCRIRSSTPQRFGSGFHYGRELLNTGRTIEEVIQAVAAEYANVPAWADPIDWAVEFETLKALLTGHAWRYQNDNVEVVAVELSFEIPLVNPDTGATSRTFTLAGKIDVIVRLADGRLAVLEYKTAGEDIAPDSEYWLRLRCDGQISQYVIAARALGHDVATVMYDVTRKPTIRLRQNETPEAFGKRLLEDIGNRPEYYYQRREVPRLEDELAQYKAELWQQAQQLIETRRRAALLDDPAKAHFRNVSKMTCGMCDFANLCLTGVHVDPANPPAGFQVLDNVHPELAVEGV